MDLCSDLKHIPSYLTKQSPLSQDFFNMPSTRFYDGSARQQRKQKAPKVDRAIAKLRSEQRRDRDQRFNAAIADLLAQADNGISKIKEEHKRSEAFIRMALGVGGPEFRGSDRKATSYNAWLSVRMQEVNDGELIFVYDLKVRWYNSPPGLTRVERHKNGKEKMNMSQFKEKHGHEYEEIKGDSDKCEEYLETLQKAREAKPTTAKKYHRAAQLDINATMNDMFGLVSHYQFKYPQITPLIYWHA